MTAGSVLGVLLPKDVSGTLMMLVLYAMQVTLKFKFVLPMVLPPVRVVLRLVTMDAGVQFVTTSGPPLMLLLSADN